MQIERVGSTADQLGEAICWDHQAKRLYWADATGGVIHRLNPATGDREDFKAPSWVGALWLSQSGRIFVNLHNGTYTFNPTTSIVEPYALLDAPEDGVRLNDAKVDRKGRVITGTACLDFQSATNYRGKYFALDTDRSFRTIENNVGVTNGPCFSPKGDVLYVADTARRIVWSYDYDAENGNVSGKRTFVDNSILDGAPDGATVDAEGCLWQTIVTRGVLLRISPTGKLITTLPLPIRGPTNVAFAGQQLDVLYVTSFSRSLTMTASEEGAGGLFAIYDLGVGGLEEARFRD